MKKALSMISISFIIAASGCGTNSKQLKNDQKTFSTASQIMKNARVSYLGPEGTYTEEAAQYFFQGGAVFIPHATVPEAIEAVVSKNADYAVIPGASIDDISLVCSQSVISGLNLRAFVSSMLPLGI